MLDAQITEDKKARAFVRPNYEPTDDYTTGYVEELGEYLGLIGPLTRKSTRVKLIRCLSDFLMACRGRYGELIAWPTHQRHYIDAPYGRKIAERVKEVILLHEYLIPSEKSSVRDKLAERFLVNFLTLQDLKFAFHGIGPLIEVRESKQRGSQKKKSKTIPLTQFPETEVNRLRKQMNQILKVWRDQPLEGKLGEIWASGKRIFNNSNIKHGGRVYGDWQSLDEEQRLQLEVVLLFRPDCSPVKVDQGFFSGCHSHGFGLVGMDLIRGQDAMGRVGPLGIVIGQPFSNVASSL
jgi:hypothetical protein